MFAMEETFNNTSIHGDSGAVSGSEGKSKRWGEPAKEIRKESELPLRTESYRASSAASWLGIKYALYYSVQ